MTQGDARLHVNPQVLIVDALLLLPVLFMTIYSGVKVCHAR